MSQSLSSLRAIAARALEYVAAGQVVGLGTGHAATAFIEVLAQRVGQGLAIRGIATSQASAELATSLGIPLTNFGEVDGIDVDVDGADEVDPQLNLIKGYGGGLLRQKIVAAASRRVIILVGPEKLVPTLGSRGKLPVEVVPYGMAYCARRLERLGLSCEPRTLDGSLLKTDNGNHILDCHVGTIDQPQQLDEQLRGIPGVVGTGLFIGMAHSVLIARGDHVEVRNRSSASSGSVLTVNGGSSSIKFALYAPGDPPARLVSGKLERIGTLEASLEISPSDRNPAERRGVSASDHAQAVLRLVEWFDEHVGLATVSAVGHRIVHGGQHYCQPARIDSGRWWPN